MISAQTMVVDGETLGAFRVDDWPNPRRVFKTVMIHSDDFVGAVTVQATLHVNPSEDDWFDIHVEVFDIVPPMTPTARNRYFNSRDSYVWMRATVFTMKGRIDRVTVI